MGIIMEQDGQTLLVSIVESADNSVSVVDITNAPDSVVLLAGPNGNTFFRSEGLPEPFPGNTTNTWGSAWKTTTDAVDGAKILFSRDYGGELYEMEDRLDTVTKMAKFRKYSDAEDAAWHDGFTCIKKIVDVSEKNVSGIVDGVVLPR